MTVTPSTNATFVNHGGIGFCADATLALPITEEARHQALRLVAVFDEQTLREIQPPASGWDDATLIQALEPQRPYVQSFAPVDAYLGQTWIGSTEV